eukprot:TRINITY_DN2103_c0_g2_i1.p1 TRINITY_DN2103_c0_g2~~TRINITY_DN2103_c0_g2_i1.p1  ORF type:complete len:579 (-),score=53.80 TRINITY_DN2103_c0_g2_i1:173-1909(-)
MTAFQVKSRVQVGMSAAQATTPHAFRKELATITVATSLALDGTGQVTHSVYLSVRCLRTMPAIDNLYLIASSPEYGFQPCDPDGSMNLPRTRNMEFFEKVQKFLPYVKIGYDWAGSTNSGNEFHKDVPMWAAWQGDKARWESFYRDDPEMLAKWQDPSPEDYNPDGRLFHMMTQSLWFHIYKGQVKGGIRAHATHVQRVNVVRIDGGPVTKVEHAEMPEMIDEVKRDLASLTVYNTIVDCHRNYVSELLQDLKAHTNYPYEKVYIVKRTREDGYPLGGVYMMDPRKNEIVRHRGPILSKCMSSSFRNATVMTSLGGKLFIITGKARGNTKDHKAGGGGGVYILNAADPSPCNGPLSGGCTWNGFQDATCMAASEKLQKVYVVTHGSGIVHQLDPQNNRDVRHVASGFENATCMAELDGKLYITTGVMNGFKGGGGLFEVDPVQQTTTQIRNDGTYANATCMTSMDGYLYIICGKMGGCKGGGGVYKQPPSSASSSTVRKGGFANAVCMTAVCGKLYIVTGQVDGASGDGGIYGFDPDDGDVDGHNVTRTGLEGWEGSLCMTSQGPSSLLDEYLHEAAQ